MHLIFDAFIVAVIGGLIYALHNHKLSLAEIQSVFEGEVEWLKSRVTALEKLVDKK